MKEKNQYIIPSTEQDRILLREKIKRFLENSGLVPPVSREQLTTLSFQFINDEQLTRDFWGWIMVEMNNRIWNETFSQIPYEKRMLLLPKCLSNSAECTAEIDEFGLLCRKCGKCSISSLQDKADDVGMLSLVAEGFTSIIGLIESGAIDAVIGVGCLESLEKAFPLLVDNAVPGMAIALNCSGCKDTQVDTNYVEKVIHSISVHNRKQLDYEHLKTKINRWFSTENLVTLLGDASDQTSQIACQWISGDGKRWRPYLLASVYMAMTGNENIPEIVKLAAISVEYFHKASLIHDDIQDNDNLRYGKPTINALYGIPIAINVGDKMLVDGYKILAECNKMELIKEASNAHVALCLGQGLELEWCRNPHPLKMDEVIRIFENKTVPAFSVALTFAVICANEDDNTKAILEKFAHALGIAYQLLDDLDDFQPGVHVHLRPTSVLAAICEDCDDDEFIRDLLTQEDIAEFLNSNKQLLNKAKDRVNDLAETYRQQALDSLSPIKNTELKKLLFRVTKKILK